MIAVQVVMDNHSVYPSSQNAVVIVGAGPAGASLAIRLATAGHAVTLIEKERFPREKLCGEFISPECFRHFDEIGVGEDMFSRGGARVTETRFFDAAGRSVAVPTRWFGHGEFALSLSRAQMDDALLRRAKEAGVNVLEGFRVGGVNVDGDRVGAVSVKAEDGGKESIRGDVFIDATGRASVLSRLIEKEQTAAQPERSKLIAFKNHLWGVAIDPGVCEIYVFKGGYGGLSSVEQGKANLCCIVDADAAKQFIGKTNKHIELVSTRNPQAARTLRNALPAGEWLAVPIGEFGRKRAPALSNLFSIGDAAAFIDPFTGSGMLMALESSELLSHCIEECGISAARLSETYGHAHARKFRNRLAASAVLRRAAFMPRLATAAIVAAGLSDRLRERLARATRAGSRLYGGRA